MTQGIDAVKARNARKAPVTPPAFTVVVDPNGNGDVRTIQEAVNLLPSNGGCLVLREGTHNISATIALPSKPIRFVGANGEVPLKLLGYSNVPLSVVVSSGTGVTPLFSVSSSFNSITFENIKFSGSNVSVLDVQGYYNVIFKNCQFVVNTSGAVVKANYLNSVGYSYFQNCYFSSDVTGCYILNSLSSGASWCTLENCVSVNLSRIVSDGDVVLTNCSIQTTPLVNTVIFSTRSLNVSDCYLILGTKGEIRFNSNGYYRIVNSSIFCYSMGWSGSTGSYYVYAANSMISTTIIDGTWASEGSFIGCSLSATTSFKWGDPSIFIPDANTIFSACKLGSSTSENFNFVNCYLSNCRFIANTNAFVDCRVSAPISLWGKPSLTFTRTTVDDTRVRSVNTDVSLDDTDGLLLVDASGALRTESLPTASQYTYKVFTVKKTDATANTVVLLATGGATIDGAASVVLTQQNQTVTVQSDGTNWKILCSYNPLVAGVQKYVNLLGATTDAYVQQYDHTGTNGLLGNGTVVNIADTGWLEATPSGATDRNWQCCAADGNKVLAGVNAGGWGRLYRSLDGGLTWSEVTPAGASSYGWCCCGVSGSNMLAGIFGGRIYRSTDSGASWSEVTPAGAADRSWLCCAVSGSVMLAGDYGGRLYLSTDSGATWGEATPAGAVNKDWACCAVSGTNLLAGILGGRIYRSTNTGGSWSEVTPAGAADMLWNACAVSGSVMMAAVWSGRLYLSTNSGGTWGEATPAGAADKNWQCCGANGNVLMAGIGPGRLYLSTNTGGSWSEQQPAGAVDKFWGNCAVSSITIIAGVFNGRLYYDRYNSTALLTVRRTVTDLFATAGATKEDVVGPGASFSFSWDDLIGAGLPPYTDVKVEIKSTTPGDPAAFKIAASTQ